MTTLPQADALEALRRRMDEPTPTTFVFEQPGDTIIGTYVRCEVLGTQYTDACPVHVLQTMDGELHSVWAFHAALRERMRREDPQAGELVAIRYDGPKRNRADTADYKSYTVHVNREKPVLDVAPADDAQAYEGEDEVF